MSAYVLAADPYWIERSLCSYYDLVDRIVLSFDQGGRGWTGCAIRSDEAVRRVKAMDPEGKVQLCGGNFARTSHTPLENDTHQRQVALLEAEKGIDWVLQIDTDEILPDPAALQQAIALAERHDAVAVEWPMRVFFATLRDGRWLEVRDEHGRERFEYPGPIAVRAGTRLVEARKASGPFVRLLVEGDDRSLQVTRPPARGEIRVPSLRSDQAICHLSWLGPPERIRQKISSWGHSQGWRSWAFYYLRWKPAPYRWRHMRNFHPFEDALWPTLRPSAVQPCGDSMAVPR